MENNEHLLKFKNIELVDYINKTHPKADLIAIESERNTLAKLLKTVDEVTFQYFIQKQDPLLKLLETHQKCSEIIKEFQGSQKTQVSQAEEVVLYSTELKKAFDSFENDMAIFLTDERRFIASAIFNQEKVICVLTNDLLFIGECGEENTKKYKLKRSVSKEVVQMEIDGETLKISLDGSICEVKGSKMDISNFYESFQEVSYTFIVEDKKVQLDYELIGYYLETRKYIGLVEYLGGFDGAAEENLPNLLENAAFLDEYSLFAVGTITKDPTNFYKIFFCERFKSGLAQINKIQTLQRYINDIFEFLREFSQELLKCHEKNYLTKSMYILIIEKCVKYALHYVEPRIANHKELHHGEKHGEVMDVIREKLQFSNLNFRYLIKEMEFKRIRSQGLMEQGKQKIQAEIESFLQGKG